MPLMQTSGNVTADAYAGGVALKANYIEDVFVTWLSTGTGTTRTVTGPDMTMGGLSITKSRSAATGWHFVDTVRGAGNSLSSNTTAANASESTGVTAFTSTGTSIGAAAEYNTSSATYVDYLLKKQPKFFDVVTYTGNGVNGRQIAHSLGSTPGVVIVKRLNGTGSWCVYAPAIGSPTDSMLILNSTDGAIDHSGYFGALSSTTFIVNNSFGGAITTNTNGYTYVAYLFAHNAGGFGATGTDNVISCGSYTAAASAVTVNLGYEPQWVMVKSATNAANWLIIDTMRGAPNTTASSGWANLYPNTSGAEQDFYSMITPTATGFIVDQNVNQSSLVNGSGTYIYIAIRRGPMKVPTDGTKVFAPVTYAGIGSNQTITNVGFPPDLFMANWRANTKGNFEDRLRGTSAYLQSTETGAEASNASNIVSYDMSGITLGVNNLNNKDGASFIGYFYQRAPGFFDEVCYTGTGVATTINHNLGIAPELVIVKNRSIASQWRAWSTYITQAYDTSLRLNSDAAVAASGYTLWANSGNLPIMNSTTFSIGATNDGNTNSSGNSYVAYLFATCPGVSKVGSYTGTGGTQTIACGFAAGARFVLVKATSTTGNWVVVDTARGMVAGTDPYLNLNTTAAEVNANNIYTTTGGFQLVSSDANTNANGVSYIFLAVA